MQGVRAEIAEDGREVQGEQLFPRLLWETVDDKWVGGFPGVLFDRRLTAECRFNVRRAHRSSSENTNAIRGCSAFVADLRCFRWEVTFVAVLDVGGGWRHCRKDNCIGLRNLLRLYVRLSTASHIQLSLTMGT